MVQDRPEITDAEVFGCLEKVRLGDEDAAAALIRYMYPFVSRIVRSNSSKMDGDEDLVQTVLIKVFKGLSQFSGQVPFKHWVSRIAVNTCMNLIRYEKSRPEIRLSDLTPEETYVVESLAVSEEPLDTRWGSAARELVQLLVGCLKPEERLLIRLVYLEDFTPEEASQSTGWSLGAVSMRISRAKAKMRKRNEQLNQQLKQP